MAHVDIQITTDPARVDVDLVHRFLSESSYWARGRSRDVVLRSIQNSLCFTLLVDDQQVGFARVATDRAVFGYLNPAHNRQTTFTSTIALPAMRTGKREP
jgi:hypothetical protein